MPEEETREIQLKHLIRARPKPKKRIKIVETDRRKDDYGERPISRTMVRLKGKPVGKGSISKLPIEELFSSHEVPNVDSVWGPPINQFSPPVEPVHVEPAFTEIALVTAGQPETTTTTTTTTPTTVSAPSELLEFTDFIKQLLQRKQGWKMKNASRRKSKEKTRPIGETASTTNTPFITAPHAPTETTVIENGWSVMDSRSGSVNNEEDSSTASSDEEAMKEMYKRLQPKKPQFPRKAIDGSSVPPQIHIIQEGSVEQIDIGQYKFIGTITLVQDQGKNILVDTGLSTDEEAKNRLIAKLENYGVQPSNVHFVVTTHGHPDHAGNANLFPDALHYVGHFSLLHSTFKLNELFEREKLALNANVELQKTPGHTSEDISVIVKHTQAYGNVAICGDTFIALEDIMYPAMWQPLAYNESQQRDSRRKIICQVDSIVPGHGPMFQVSPDMRQKFRCDRLG